MPEMGTANEVMESRLPLPAVVIELWTVSVAPNAGGVFTVACRLGGQKAGLTNPTVVVPAVGNQVQLCWGEKAIAIKQLCCGARSKLAPGEPAQVSTSVKL